MNTALSVLPSGEEVVKNLVMIINLETVKDDWQDDHRWNATSAAREKKYNVTASNDQDVHIEPGDSTLDAYSVKRHRYIHDSATDYHRLIVTVKEPSGRTFPLALVQYRFDNEPHPVSNKPHGNSKDGVPFVPTKRSTIQKLTAEVQKQRSVKRAIFNVEESENSMMASSQSSLPRNERQGKYLKSKLNPKSSDPISTLLSMQYEEQEKFIQEITIEDNQPNVIIYNNEHIEHIKKFCTNEGENSPFCVDMTFNMGNFYVVVTTYRHLQVTSTKTKKEPVMIGPIMLTTKKDRKSYQRLFQKMISACPDLRNTLKAYGSDGELALIQALELEFPFALGFLCRTHILRNIERMIKTELHLSDSFYKMISQDIFGNKEQRGLVDCDNRNDFDENVSKLKVKWNKREEKERERKKMPASPKFFIYFQKNKSEVIYNHSRPSLLREAGVKDEMFDNNCPESMNAALKKWSEEGKASIAQVVTNIKDFMKKQQHDIKKAFTGISGPYALKDEYSDAKLSEFWSPPISERTLFLKKVSTLPLKVHNNEPQRSVVDDIDKLNTVFEKSHVAAIKVKVQRILNGNILHGFNGMKSRLVSSETGYQPHVILCPGLHRYVCGTPCFQYQAYKICSHALAAAADNNELSQFIDYFI